MLKNEGFGAVVSEVRCCLQIRAPEYNEMNRLNTQKLKLSEQKILPLIDRPTHTETRDKNAA